MDDECVLKVLLRAISSLQSRVDELENERISEKKKKKPCRVVDFAMSKSYLRD